jgi:hypothetical protein
MALAAKPGFIDSIMAASGTIKRNGDQIELTRFRDRMRSLGSR